LSDLAAMGARPLAMFLVIAASPSMSRRHLKKILQGMARAASAASCQLAGGDLSSTSGPLNLTLTLLGTLPRGQALRRSTARCGDDLWVSGKIGEASCGLDALLKRRRAVASTQALLKRLRGPDRVQHQKFLQPQARLVLGEYLRARASACIDLSDGLLADARRLCSASRLAAYIDSARLPRSKNVSLHKALFGGEDFELLFCANPAQRSLLRRWGRRHGIELTKIGTMRQGKQVYVDGERLESSPEFDHFS